MKKFFKILMVLALLSGAALSCTKDYSKEIADVQKQNQDLQALVASLQNALNSTNATVSQLSATSEKHTGEIAQIIADHASDIAELAATDGVLAAKILELIDADADLEQAIEDLDAKIAGKLAELLVTHNTDIETVKTIFDGKLADLKTVLLEALDTKARELQEQIDDLDGRVTVAEGEIDDIQTTLGEIAITLNTHKELIDANNQLIQKNIADIKAAQDAIAELQAQVATLSARLTNIVAAPAKDVEILTFKWKTIERTTVNMNFVVAPAEAAEAVAEGFKNGDVDIKLVINSGITRKEATSKATYNYVIIPDAVVAGDDGVITVSAVADTAFASLTPEVKGNAAETTWDYYASLVVSGEDKAGAWERISDPVKPIIGSMDEVKYAWYAGNKKVNIIPSIELKSGNFGAKDSVAVVGEKPYLYIVKADWDWKSDEYKVENIIAGYEPKFVIGTTAYSVAEFKEAFELPDTLDIAPRFVDLKQTFTKPFEWGGATEVSKTQADSALFKATVKADSTINAYGLNIVLPEKEADQVEVVGQETEFTATNIAFGKVDTCDLCVYFVQRIGKHVQAEKAVEKTLDVKFGINGNPAQAAKIDTTFKQVTWKSTTQIGEGKEANIINDKKDTVGTAAINVHGVDHKLVDVNVVVPYTDKPQNLKAILIQDAKKNAAGTITVVEYGDYFDLTVEPYHDAVSATYDAGEIYVPRKIDQTSFTTKITVKNLFQHINNWLIKDAKTKADSAVVYDWFNNKAFKNPKYTVTPTNAGTAVLSFNDTKDSICVTFTKGTKFVEGTSVTISVKDTIDSVIAFNYNVTFTPKKPGVKVATIGGFVVNDTITVGGKLVGNKYKIDDINLANYFKVVGLNEKSEKDTKIEVKFTNTPKGVKYSESDSVYTVTEGALNKDAKVMWDVLKKTSFKLTAQALLEDDKVSDPITVTIQTADPILTIADVKIDSTLHGKEAKFELLKSLKISSILDDKTNIYPNGLNPFDGEVKVVKSDMSDWSCTVNGENYKNQLANLCTFADDELTYNAHDALGTVVITIPYKFTYKLGEKDFNVILTIN